MKEWLFSLILLLYGLAFLKASFTETNFHVFSLDEKFFVKQILGRLPQTNVTGHAWFFSLCKCPKVLTVVTSTLIIRLFKLTVVNLACNCLRAGCSIKKGQAKDEIQFSTGNDPLEKDRSNQEVNFKRAHSRRRP